MSNVVSFKPHPRGKAVGDQDEDRGRILLFTGVRYLRDEPLGEPLPDHEAVLCEASVDAETAATERLKA